MYIGALFGLILKVDWLGRKPVFSDSSNAIPQVLLL